MIFHSSLPLTQLSTLQSYSTVSSIDTLTFDTTRGSMRVIRPRTLVFAYDKGTDDTRIIVTSYTYSIAAVSFFCPRSILSRWNQFNLNRNNLMLREIYPLIRWCPGNCFINLTRKNESSYKFVCFVWFILLLNRSELLIRQSWLFIPINNRYVMMTLMTKMMMIMIIISIIDYYSSKIDEWWKIAILLRIT